MLCEFAPADAVLCDDYVGESFEFFKIARRSSGYSRQDDTLVAWVNDARDEQRRRAVLRYLVRAPRGRSLASRLRSGDLPEWIREVLNGSDDQHLLRDLDSDERKRIIGELDPKRLVVIPPPPPPSPPKSPVLEQVYKWWTDNRISERQRYAGSVFPNGFRHQDLGKGSGSGRDGIDRLAWFTMFALACYQSFGRTQDGQHRRFIEHGMNAGWWAELARPIADDDRPWRDRLRQWTSPSPDERRKLPGQEHIRWKRTLVDLYAIARGLEDFVLLLREFPRFVDENDHVLLNQVLVPESKLAQELGIQNAPPIDRTLGIGANWLMRELICNGVYDSDQAPLIERYCWMPSKRVRVLLRALGADVTDSAVSERIYDFVVAELDDSRARFYGDYDLPLQIITRSDYRGLLEQWFRESGKDFPDFREDMDSGDHA